MIIISVFSPYPIHIGNSACPADGMMIVISHDVACRRVSSGLPAFPGLRGISPTPNIARDPSPA